MGFTNIPNSYVTELLVESGSIFPIAATSISMVVVPVSLNNRGDGQLKEATPPGMIYCVDVALDVAAEVKVATAVVDPDEAKVLLDSVKVTTRLFAAISRISSEAVDSLLT